MYDVSNPDIQYTNSHGYREAIRAVFLMNKTPPKNTLLQRADLDDESWDEILFDGHAISNGMRDIYEKTEDHPLFAELYEIAAAQMISDDFNIGQAVLMSYDYFRLYHACICKYLTNADAFTETCSEYLQLKYALTK